MQHEENKWATLEETIKLGRKTGVDRVQAVQCTNTGIYYAKLITGRLKNLTQQELLDRIDVLSAAVKKADISINGNHQPRDLYEYVEWLENIYEFETNPPCGCESEMVRG